MKTDRETATLELCSGSDFGIEFPFWAAISPLPTGLRARISTNGQSGPHIQVFTGGVLAKSYVPKGSNTPLVVQARTTTPKDTVQAPLGLASFSVTYQFGQPCEVPYKVVERARLDTLEFIEAIVVTSPSFPRLWAEAVKASVDQRQTKHAR